MTSWIQSKKTLRILFLICLLTLCMNNIYALFETEPRIIPAQSLGYAGSQYVPMESAVVKADSPVNLKYELRVDGKSDKNATIAVRVKIPSQVDVTPMNWFGIQSLTLEDGQEIIPFDTYTDDKYQYYEFLIPQVENGISRFEIQCIFSSSLIGELVPIQISFDWYKKPFLSVLGTTIGSIAGVAAGAITFAVTRNVAAALGVGSAIGFTGIAGGNYATYNAQQEALQSIKAEYNRTPLHSSNTTFSVQVTQ